MIGAVFVQCFEQRLQVLDRHPSLDVVNRIEDKASPGTKNLDALAEEGHTVRVERLMESWESVEAQLADLPTE